MVVLKATDDFQVEWEDPADAEVTWAWEPLHAPRPLPPLAIDVGEALLAVAFPGRRLHVNGYSYFPQGGGGSFPAPPQLPEGETAGQVWQEDYLPKIRAECERLRDTDFDAMTAPEIVESLDGLFDRAARRFALTMAVVFMGFGRPADEFANFCEEALGDAHAVLATTMLQGIENETLASGLRLERLAELARESPGVANAVGAGRFGEIGSATGGQEFLDQLEAYLAEDGWRVQTWDDLHVPTWAENKDVPLGLVRRYLADPERAPQAARRRALAQRESTVRDAESRLADADQLERFRSLLSAAQAHVPVSEGRAKWQGINVGLMRRPILALGRKLAAAEALEQPDDVFFLRLEELKELGRGGDGSSPRAEIPRRRADLERWEHLIPPRTLGKPPASDHGPMRDRFHGGGVSVSSEPRIVNGNAASRGTASGRARVIMTLEDAHRVEAGDVLVCPSTAPPWTPLFAVVSAVVADSGGVLCHSAIAAREYGVPCVVGTVVGTQKIPDNARVTVDGSQGIVRIEDS